MSETDLDDHQSRVTIVRWRDIDHPTSTELGM